MIADGAGAWPGHVSALPEKLAAQVARRLEDEIIDRGWPVGEVLGSESELQGRFGVSRSVLREAVRLLEHEQIGRMRRGPGGGLVVRAPDASPATRALVIYLEYIGTSVEDLMRARLLLEPLAARLAAETLTEDGIDRLRAAAGREQAQADEPGPFMNDEFHVLLGQLSGNVVLQLFTEVLTRLTARYASFSRRTSGEAVSAANALAAARHIEIAEAVTAGNAVDAHNRLTAHRVRRPTQRMRTRPADPNPDDDGPGRKLAEITAGRIHDDIVGEGRQIGEVLGSESELLARYGVSRAVLREAVHILEHHSVARMRRGPGGLVILEPDPTADIHTMALYASHHGLSPGHLRVVREAIELGCVQVVTANIPISAAARLRAALDLAADEGDAGNVFHTELAELAANPVLTLFLRILTELWARNDRDERSPEPAGKDKAWRAHDKILDAVLAGDEGLALHRMRRHLQSLTAWWH